jgi:hypothetical protein
MVFQEVTNVRTLTVLLAIAALGGSAAPEQKKAKSFQARE